MFMTRRGFLTSTAALTTLPFLERLALAAGPSGHLTFGLSSYPPSMEPFLSSGTAAATVRLLMHRGLFGYAPDSSLRGELAESWENDGSTGWTIRLREAYWHDGSPVTSEDVRYTIETVSAEGSTAYMRVQMQQIASIDSSDPRIVRLTTTSPIATLPLWFSSYYLPIIKKDSWSANETGIGAGPFRMTGFERGQKIEFEAFDRYYREGLPKLKSVTFVAYPDENLRVAALTAGDVDIIEYVPWQSMEMIEADPNLRLDTTVGPFMVLQYNCTKKPFDDPRVRRAMAHAIKREDIVAAAFYGRGRPLEGFPIAENSPYYDEALDHAWNYDPDKAKALLKEAGLEGGFSATLLSTAQYGMHKTTAEVVQQYLAAIGVQVELVLPDWATRLSLGDKGQYDLAIQGTAWETADPDSWSQMIDDRLAQSSSRSYGMKLPEIAALLDKGRAEFDPEKRKAIYAEIHRRVMEACPVAGLAWRAQGYAMKKEVQGFTNIPGPITFYSGTTLEEASI